MARTLNTPPYYGYSLRPGVTFTYLGVAVNERAQVIMDDEKPAANIFAAGEIMAGNILGKGYMAGFGMTIGTVFGRVVSYPAMVLTFSVLALCVVIGLWRGFCSFWQGTGKSSRALLDLHANLRAISDVLRLKYLDGGGYGCNYRDDRFSMLRKYLHHAVFYGFLFCLASTTVAAFYDHPAAAADFSGEKIE